MLGLIYNLLRRPRIFNPQQNFEAVQDCAFLGCSVNTDNNITQRAEEVLLELLGLTFDLMLKFKHHTKNIGNKMQAKNDALKTVTGSTGGKTRRLKTGIESMYKN